MMTFLGQISAAVAMGACAFAHVTLNPNYGAEAGRYKKFDVKIPHGTNGLETTKIEIHIPHGVRSARPHAIHGWDIEIASRTIPEYTSHSTTYNTAPSKITYTAKCTGAATKEDPCTNDDHPGLDHAHLLEIGMQISLFCDFGVDRITGLATNDATFWQNQHTLWFNVVQYVSTPGTNSGNDDVSTALAWTAQSKDMEAWGSGSGRPSPYLFVYSSEACSTTTTGGVERGMRWGAEGEIIPPVSDQDPIKTKAEVLSIVDEELLALREELAELMALNDDNTKANSNTETAALALGIAGMSVSVIAVLCVVALFLSRAKLVYKNDPVAPSIDTFVELK